MSFVKAQNLALYFEQTTTVTCWQVDARRGWMRGLFHDNFAADHFVGGGAAHHGFAGKRPTAAGAFARRRCVIFNNTLDKALHQGALAAFAVLK